MIAVKGPTNCSGFICLLDTYLSSGHVGVGPGVKTAVGITDIVLILQSYQIL